MKKSIRNISLGILAAGALLFCLDLATTAAQARTRVRQNGNTVTITSTDSQKGKKNKQTTKIASGNGDYQISYSMSDGGNKNYLITGDKVYEIDENGNRREVKGKRQADGTIVINPNDDGNTSNYRVRKDKDGVSVITYDGDQRSGRSSSSSRTTTHTRKTQGKYDDPLYDGGGSYVVKESGSANQTMKRVLKNLGDFSGITASRAINIVYTQGKPGEIIIEGPAKYVEKIEISKDNSGRLEIENNYRGNIEGNKVTVTCSSTTMKYLDLSTACNFTSTREIIVNSSFNIETSSASNVSIPNLHCQTLNVDGSSASKIDINSVVSSNVNLDLSSASNFSAQQVCSSGVAELDFSSASDAKIERLECKTLDASCSSASTCKIRDIMANKVNVSCSSTASFYTRGAIVVYGTPGVADLTCSSMSKIEIDALQCKKAIFGSSSQSNMEVKLLDVDDVGIDVSNSNIELTGKAKYANITAGYLGIVNCRNLDVRTADVGAARNGKVTIKAANINYK